MAPSHVHRIVVAAHSSGPMDENKVFRSETVPYDLQAGESEAIVQTLYVSVDAGFRVFLEKDLDLPSVTPIQVGDVMRASGVGVVVEVGKGTQELSVGDFVYYTPGWQDWGVYKEDTLKVLQVPDGVELVDFLGISSLTAYVGLTHIGKVKSGETLLVSSAGGAVGHVACQIGKVLGAKVIAIAGSQEKCEILEKVLGVDKTLNYKNPTFRDDLIAVGGIDVFFDNVGGEMLDLVMTRINQFGRIILCGAVSNINGLPHAGLTNYMNLIVKSAKIEGFLLPHYSSLFPGALEQMSAWIAGGKLKRKFIVFDQLESAPQAMASLFNGGSTQIGKTVVKVADIPATTEL